MPIISRTRIEHKSGSTMDALVLGENLSGRIILTITKDVVFSYSTTDGATSSEEGASGGKCYHVDRQAHTLK